MDTFTHGLQITAVGMVLVFLSLVIVSVLIWALDKIFRPPVIATEAAAPRPRPAPVSVEPAAAVPAGGPSLADQAAALAVALVLGRTKQGQGRQAATGAQYTRAPMPWERPVSEDDEPSQGEIITVISVDPGPGNWKAKGRLGAME